MKKKLLSLVLAASMVIGLAGCGGSGDNAAESTGEDGSKTLTVAMECGYAPYNWTQSDDSNGEHAI